MPRSPSPEGPYGPGRPEGWSDAGPSGSPADRTVTRVEDGPFGAHLEPVLRRTCEGRLSSINWFRTDWQRGGAATGYASYTNDDGDEAPVVVKLPVPPRERAWLTRLQSVDHMVPRLYAHGEALNGYDMAWVVMERLPHGPLSQAWQGKEFDLLVEAAGRFYQASRDYPVPDAHEAVDWNAMLEESRRHIKSGAVDQEQRWTKALKKAHKKIKQWQTVWDDRNTSQWCHGDLHLGNALSRQAAPEGPAVLIDFALTQPGHWLEDAVYFEHLYWARRHVLKDRKLCKQIAHERKQRGLPVEENWAQLASVRRALLALSTPARLQMDGDPAQLHAALDVLEIEVGLG